MEKYDVAIVLGHELKKENSKLKLSEQTKERVDLGIDLLTNKKVEKLIMSGGHKDFGLGYGKSIAEVMKEYAISQGVNEKNILLEENSLDTIGQLLFCKICIIKPLKIKKIAIITHEYHHDRVKKEAELFLHKNVLGYYLVPSAFSEETEEKERKSLDEFFKTFSRINKEDDRELVSSLFERHKWYKKNRKMEYRIKKCGNNEIKFGQKVISDNKVFVIAEVSANHLQSFEKAKKIVKAACEAGADCVKLQTYTPSTITLNSKNMVDKNKKYFVVDIDNPDWKGKSYYELYEQAYTPWEWHNELAKIAQSYGVELFSTPFDESAVDFLEKQNVPAYKISSFDVINIPLLEKVAKTGKPIVMSVGMASLEEVERAYKTLRENGCKSIALLHCISAYPTKYEELNLVKINDLKKRFNCMVGFSDHTLTVDAPIMAVLMGARIIEKHITFNRKDKGADSSFSLEPEEFRSLVNKIREAEKDNFPTNSLMKFEHYKESLGNSMYGSGGNNEKQTKTARPSIWASKDIKNGERITKNNIKIARPGQGLPPFYYNQTLGKTAKIKIERGTPLSLKLLK
ncbi:MAG: pseudaminic acid synthase [Nanoarchaeota archaeon]